MLKPQKVLNNHAYYCQQLLFALQSKFNRLSRSFRIRRKGGHSGSGSFRGDQEPPDEQLDDYPTGSMSSLKSARERSGSMPCSAVASSGTGPGEHHGASKTWEGPSWEIPSNFLPSPIMEVTSPDFANNTPFGFVESFEVNQYLDPSSAGSCKDLGYSYKILLPLEFLAKILDFPPKSCYLLNFLIRS